jgi:geranylgeranyl diphosphate synthase type II
MAIDSRPSSAIGLTSRLRGLREQVDESLRAYLELRSGCPLALREAMAYALLAPGKRFRPLLTLLAAEACEGDVQAAMPAACAVEMIHAYSLVHDDLPAMDNDDYRRGQPTCHKKFGEGMAILVGDALLTLAFEVLARHIQPRDVAGRCCEILAEASGACQLVGGQADDMAPDPSRWTLQELDSIHRRKTGALIQAALRLGATVAQADDEEHILLETYGSNLGLAFQIADDLLDAVGDADEPGSAPRRDEELGKLTYPALLGIPASARQLELLVEYALHALVPFGPRAATLQALANQVLSRARPAFAAALA